MGEREHRESRPLSSKEKKRQQNDEKCELTGLVRTNKALASFSAQLLYGKPHNRHSLCRYGIRNPR